MKRNLIYPASSTEFKILPSAEYNILSFSIVYFSLNCTVPLQTFLDMSTCMSFLDLLPTQNFIKDFFFYTGILFWSLFSLQFILNNWCFIWNTTSRTSIGQSIKFGLFLHLTFTYKVFLLYIYIFLFYSLFVPYLLFLLFFNALFLLS